MISLLLSSVVVTPPSPLWLKLALSLHVITEYPTLDRRQEDGVIKSRCDVEQGTQMALEYFQAGDSTASEQPVLVLCHLHGTEVLLVFLGSFMSEKTLKIKSNHHPNAKLVPSLGTNGKAPWSLYPYQVFENIDRIAPSLLPSCLNLSSYEGASSSFITGCYWIVTALGNSLLNIKRFMSAIFPHLGMTLRCFWCLSHHLGH